MINMSEITDQILEETCKLNNEDYADNLAFRRNHVSYEFSSYMNHAVAFYHSKNWDGVALFTNRAKNFLKDNESKVEDKYCLQAKKCIGLFEYYIIEHCQSETARQIIEEL